MARQTDDERVSRGVPKWRVKLTKDRILTACGLIIIAFEVINSEVLQRPFHPEFVLAGLALCGIGVAQRIDRGG